MREKKETPSLQNLIAEELRKIKVIYSPPSNSSEITMSIKQQGAKGPWQALVSL